MGFCDARGAELKETIEKSGPPLSPATEKNVLLAAAAEWDSKRRKIWTHYAKYSENPQAPKR
jgi:hypothetical protein